MEKNNDPLIKKENSPSQIEAEIDRFIERQKHPSTFGTETCCAVICRQLDLRMIVLKDITDTKRPETVGEKYSENRDIFMYNLVERHFEPLEPIDGGLTFEALIKQVDIKLMAKYNDTPGERAETKKILSELKTDEPAGEGEPNKNSNKCTNEGKLVTNSSIKNKTNSGEQESSCHVATHESTQLPKKRHKTRQKTKGYAGGHVVPDRPANQKPSQ